MAAIGIKAFTERKFKVFDGRWRNSFAYPEKNFKAIIYGQSGNGKTEFSVQLTKYMARFTKVYYNSFEQGISKSLQDAIIRNKMMDVNGRVLFGDKETLEEMIARLSKPRSAGLVIIDSRDYMNLTSMQFKDLVDKFPRKSFIVVCWEQSDKPKGQYAKAIEYMADIKIQVKNFKAYPRCRYGGNVPFVIWDRKKGQGQLF